MNENIKNRLLAEAINVANSNFCCNHSHFTVGAALLTKTGKIFKGFNIENDGIQSICAERVAFVKALSENENKFAAIFVVGKKQNTKTFVKTLPCGYCRQFMSEYADKDFIIYAYDEVLKEIFEYKLCDLLPENSNL